MVGDRIVIHTCKLAYLAFSFEEVDNPCVGQEGREIKKSRRAGTYYSFVKTAAYFLEELLLEDDLEADLEDPPLEAVLEALLLEAVLEAVLEAPPLEAVLEALLLEAVLEALLLEAVLEAAAFLAGAAFFAGAAFLAVAAFLAGAAFFAGAAFLAVADFEELFEAPLEVELLLAAFFAVAMLFEFNG